MLEEMGRAATRQPVPRHGRAGRRRARACWSPATPATSCSRAVAAGEARVAVAVTDGATTPRAGRPRSAWRDDGAGAGLRLHGRGRVRPRRRRPPTSCCCWRSAPTAPRCSSTPARTARARPSPRSRCSTPPATWAGWRPTAPRWPRTRAAVRARRSRATRPARWPTGPRWRSPATASGVAEAMLDATVAYAGVRQQFGRPDRLVPGREARLRRHARGGHGGPRAAGRRGPRPSPPAGPERGRRGRLDGEGVRGRPRRSTSSAPRCSSTGASATRGRAASTST